MNKETSEQDIFDIMSAVERNELYKIKGKKVVSRWNEDVD